MPTITPEQIDFSTAAPVISEAQKLIIRVPACAGEKLIYPADHAKAGQPITDWEGKSVGEHGIVFFNYTDKSYQAVKTDGNGVIIINQITPDQAQPFLDTLQRAEAADGITLPVIKSVLTRLALAGFGDQYDSDTAFVSKQMSAAGPTSLAAGLYKRDSRDICHAVALKGEGEFQGPAASAQHFDDGAILVQQGDKARLVQPEVFYATYRAPDGSVLTPASIPVVEPRALCTTSPCA